MSGLFKIVLESEDSHDLRSILAQLRSQQEQYLLRNQILQVFAEYCTNNQKPAYFFHSSPLGELFHYTHEIIFEEEHIWFLLRTNLATQNIYRLPADLTSFERMPAQALLQLRDRWVNHDSSSLLEIDLSPFYASYPKIEDPRSIGKGLEFLNRHLSGKLFAEPQQWLEALLKMLQGLHHNNTSLFLNERIKSTTELTEQVKQALNLVSQLDPQQPFSQFYDQLQNLGFEPGWGNNALRVRETLELLNHLIESPEHGVLETFICRLPLVFRGVIVSIHGWVGQEGVLGRAETAGQVVYVLNQARSLEKQLQSDLQLAGLDEFGVEPKVIILTRLIPNCEGTTCSQPREKITGTDNAWIVRVPFRTFNPQITDNWISRCEIWPYLESFAQDAQAELVRELQGNPDLIVGNYSDGNIVAFLLAKQLQATHCHIAHALEKPKYLFSNLYWQDLEEHYHFSVQFTADLIAMNGADFILTSTQQEIVGTPENVGYYESYKCFSMPELYHVINGVELFSPKYNVVPPGIDEQFFFPYTQIENRDPKEREQVKNLLFTQEDDHIVGYLADTTKRPIFSMAPLTSVKNLTGLVECFGQDAQLQADCNLIIITSHVHSQEHMDAESKGEIDRIDQLIEGYNLQGKIRWLGLRLSTSALGEAYRVIAESGGIFVHPARFEAFGLNILEAMISGLPTFATQFGGPAEIIQDGQNGFLINPTDLSGTAAQIQQFISKCDYNPNYWDEISQASIKQVQDNYNWQVHTKQLLLLAKIYGFWNLLGEANREALRCYLEALFHLIYKPRAQQLLAKHLQG